MVSQNVEKSMGFVSANIQRRVAPQGSQNCWNLDKIANIISKLNF